jgi:hypothetical protein
MEHFMAVNRNAPEASSKRARAKSVPLPPKCRAAVTNGKHLLADGNNNSRWTRRVKDLIAAHLADQGGPENCSEATRSIIRRVATLTCELESLEAKFSIDGQASERALDLYSRVSSTNRRLLESIGIKTRKPKQLSVVDLMLENDSE